VDAEQDPAGGFLRAVGERLRAARSAAGLTQAGLERAAGVAPTTVIRFERGEATTVGDLVRLAAALGVPVRDLLP
jgi:transcriptional regulator with XRE-family HTH domain